MLPINVVTDFVYSICEGVKESKNGEHFTARCPICGDSKKSQVKRRFNLDYNKGQPIFHCFNCGESGSFLQLYSKFNNISISEAIKQLYNYDSEHLIQRLSERKREKVIEDIDKETFDYILEDCIGPNDTIEGITMSLYQKSLQTFIQDRCIPDEYEVYIAYRGKYQGRYIIPIVDGNDDIIYFQGRASSSDIIPKYDNPTVAKSSIVFNEHRFQRDKYIIVTEGILDAMMLGTQGTTCLGTHITDDFIKRLLKLTDKGIIIALDNDKAGFQSLLKFIEKNKYSSMVKYFRFPQKYKYDDINKYVTKEKDKNAYDFVVNNKHSKAAILSYMKLGGKC